MGLWELGEATMSASKLNPALKPSNSYIRSSPSSLLYVMPKANLASKMSLAVFLSYISFAILHFSFSFFFPSKAHRLLRPRTAVQPPLQTKNLHFRNLIFIIFNYVSVNTGALRSQKCHVLLELVVR